MAKQKVWILKPNLEAKTAGGVSPFRGDMYDVVMGQVVLAESEAGARKLAEENCGDESASYPAIKTWLNEKYTTCEELKGGKEAGVVLRDFRKMRRF